MRLTLNKRPKPVLENVDISRLIEPVVERASADLSARIQGFSDRSAAFVLQRLGWSEQVNAPVMSRYLPGDSIARCAWIDRQLLNFFAQYPQAEGVEVESGLSTRFHRLCEQAEWPQFSWCAINTLDVNDYLVRAFPLMDNHQCIGIVNPRENWEKHTDWRNEKPRIVVLGENSPVQNTSEFAALCDRVQAILSKDLPVIDVILTHDIEKTLYRRITEDHCLELIAAHVPRPNNKSLIDLAISLLRGRLAVKEVASFHLRITKDPSKRRY